MFVCVCFTEMTEEKKFVFFKFHVKKRKEKKSEAL